MSKSTKTYSIRMLEYLVKNNVTFTRSTAQKAFRKESKVMTGPEFNGTVMRTARQLAAEGVLVRKDRGEYTLSRSAKRKFSK